MGHRRGPVLVTANQFLPGPPCLTRFCLAAAGCSVGSLVGGLYASKGSYLDIVSKINRFTAQLSSTWLFLRDATLPATSWFNGYSFGRALEKARAGQARKHHSLTPMWTLKAR